MALAALVQAAWTRRGPLACALWPLSLVYGALRAAAWSTPPGGLARFGRPLIVVGNVVAGGAGKTPAVIAIAQHLQERGWQLGVVSRGHGRRGDAAVLIAPTHHAAEVGDEPLLIARRTGLPVAVGRRRAEAVALLLAQHPTVDVILSDDGLQHAALPRDMEIVLFDDRGAGNGWLLPAGPLREPWPRACDAVLYTGRQPAFDGWRGQRTLADEAVNGHGEQLRLQTLFERGPVTALAGIAQPGAFFDMLRARGAALAQTLALPDHHPFDAAPAGLAADGVLVCTEKDAVKLWRWRPDAWAVPLHFTPEPGFLQWLDQRLSSLHGRQTA